MLELNKEYTYKEICSVLGWKQSTGNQKMKQIREIEASYEFFHPENKKTHKPKKSYIFTRSSMQSGNKFHHIFVNTPPVFQCCPEYPDQMLKFLQLHEHAFYSYQQV